MLTLFRWLLRLTIALIVLAVLSAVLVWYFAVRSLPDYTASYPVTGITAPVEIVRSTENVPHIFGKDRRGRVLCPGPGPCAGPAVPDDPAAPRGAGPAGPRSMALAPCPPTT